MLSLNSAVFIQIAVFICVVLLCGPLLIKPTLKLIEERRAKTEGAKVKARELEGESDARLAKIEESIAEARKAGQAEREAIRLKRVVEAESIISKARDEARKEIETMRGRIEKETENARVALKSEIQSLARDIAGRLLGREVA